MKYKRREKSFNIGAYIYPALGGEEGSALQRVTEVNEELLSIQSILLNPFK